MLSEQQLSKLGSLTCKFCKQRITGDSDYRSYHFYLFHSDQIRGLIKSGLEKENCTDSEVIDYFVKDFMDKMQVVDKRERKLR